MAYFIMMVNLVFTNYIKKSFQHKDFPYWDFLILIKTMSDKTLEYKVI